MQLSLTQLSSTFERPKKKNLSEVHTPKRGKRERTGVHRWHTYYAGYAEQFVADALDVLASPETFVLDPWNGGGTTTYVAQQAGIPSLGIEINPVMSLHAQAKNLHFSAADTLLDQAVDVVALAREVIMQQRFQALDLQDWVHEEPLTALLALRESINRQVSNEEPPIFVQQVLRPSYRKTASASKTKAFFLSALFQTLRKVGKFQRGSNPTWLILNDDAKSTPTEQVFDLFLERVRAMQEDLRQAAQKVTVDMANYWVMSGNSKDLPLVDATVDVIITSPPYCTRIDYAVSTKPELLLLGQQEQDVDTLRRATMGAPVIVNKELLPKAHWGERCNDVLKAIEEHPSKASRSYYYPIFVQYFADAVESLKEILRVLKQKGRAVVVVQSSFYKEVEIPLGEIYVEMAEGFSANAEIARREIVKQHIAHINTKSSEYIKDKVYYEDVVLITR